MIFGRSAAKIAKLVSWYIVQSLERQNDILLLTIVPKRQRQTLAFEPGQYAAIGFRQGGRPTPMRCFSIVSTPSSGAVQFAMRIRGNFTRAVASLQPGDTVRVQGPFGDFTINPDYDRRIVMLAGGIGITPFLSMIRDAAEQRSPFPMTLLFSNHLASHIPFKTQLQTLAQRTNLQIQFFVSDTTGRISGRHIQELTAAGNNATTYFICGPKGFTHSMESALQRAGIHDSRIISESFAANAAVAAGSSRFAIQPLTYGLTTAMLVLATGGIMLLDLHQNLPRLSPTVTNSQVRSPIVTAEKSTTNGSDSNTPTETVTPQTSSANSSAKDYYQPPISSVS